MLLLQAVTPPPLPNRVKTILLQVHWYVTSIVAASSEPEILGACDMIILS